MTEQQVESHIIQHIQKFYGQNVGVTVGRETTIDQLGLDSLDKTELVIHVEREFSMTLPDEDWETCDDVGKLIDAVNRVLGQ